MVVVERLKTGVRGFDKLIAGGIPRGFFVAVVGEPGTGKTVFSLHFAWQGVKEGDKVIYVTTEESRESIIKQAEMLGMDLGRAVDEGRMIIIDALMRSREDEWSLEEVSVEELINKVIQAKKALGYGRARLIIDSMSAFWLDKPAMARKYSYTVKRVLYRWDFTTLLISQYAITTQSLPYDTPILVRRGRYVRVVEIGRLASEVLGGEGVAALEDKVYTLSADPASGKVGWGRITGVFAHRRAGPLYEIRDLRGGRLRVTGNHSIYVYRGGALELVGAGSVSSGSVLAALSKLDLDLLGKEVNIAELLWDAGYRWFTLECGWRRALRLVDAFRIKGWGAVDECVIVDNSGGWVEARVELTDGFMELLGYLFGGGARTSEGGIRVRVGCGDVHSIIGSALGVLESLGFEVEVEGCSIVFRPGSALAGAVRDLLLAPWSRQGPEVPPLVLASPRSFKAAFMRGLLKSVGAVPKVAAGDPVRAAGLTLIASSLGVDYSFAGGGEMLSMGLVAARNASGGIAGATASLVEAARGGSEGTLEPLPVVGVSVVPGPDTVYDISVEGRENFLAGPSWVLVHNSAFGWGLEHIADGIIRFRRAIVGGELRRYVLVEKMRQTPHDLRIHRVEIREGEGMVILGPVKIRREDLALPPDVARRIARSSIWSRIEEEGDNSEEG